MGPTDEAAFIVTKLRQLASKFNRLAETSVVCCPHSSIKEAGRLTMRASDLGYLPGIDGLPELVAWAKTPTPPLNGRNAVSVHCPENVFTQLAGFNTVVCELTADGLKIVRGDGGGLLPDAMPATLPALPPMQRMTEQKTAAHYATVCDWLANRVDETRSRQATNSVGSGPPAGYVLLSTEKPNDGVALFDVAYVIEGDDTAAVSTVKRWSDSKKLSAQSIGKCPLDGRKSLYRLSEILADVAKILNLSQSEVNKYRQTLTAKLRHPATD